MQIVISHFVCGHACTKSIHYNIRGLRERENKFHTKMTGNAVFCQGLQWRKDDQLATPPQTCRLPTPVYSCTIFGSWTYDDCRMIVGISSFRRKQPWLNPLSQANHSTLSKHNALAEIGYTVSEIIARMLLYSVSPAMHGFSLPKSQCTSAPEG